MYQGVSNEIAQWLIVGTCPVEITGSVSEHGRDERWQTTGLTSKRSKSLLTSSVSVDDGADGALRFTVEAAVEPFERSSLLPRWGDHAA